jgi:biotin carboxylase
LAKGYDCIEAAMKDVTSYPWPVIVKPTDAAGSKGVTRVDKAEDLEPALAYAFKHSLSGHIIVEEFIEKQGCSSDTDSMSIDGKLVFTSFCAQRFDLHATNPYTPAAYSWPSTFTKEQEDYLTSEIQRLITLLDLKTVVYNIETRIGTNGKPYIMELTPRGGGNRLCEMLRYATGVDMITAITRAIVGDSIAPITQKPYNGHWAEIILHADKTGTFQELAINKPEYQEYVIEADLWVQRGDHVDSFEGANNAIGTLVMQFPTAEELEYAITHQQEWLTIAVAS